MKIELDAGHGYSTPGKRSPNGMKEYEFNRAVANYAKALLNGYKNVTVSFAHSDSRDVPLSERTNTANKEKADVFVSIHANAFGSGGWTSANGIETFVYSSRPKGATALATKVQRNLIAETGLTNRGVKAANFHVLRETAMDAILVEAGFMTHKGDAAKLKDDAYRRKVAKAIVDGLAEQYKLTKKPEPKPTSVPGADKHVHRVIVDGKQVGAFGEAKNVAEAVEKAVKSGAKSVKVERV